MAAERSRRLEPGCSSHLLRNKKIPPPPTLPPWRKKKSTNCEKINFDPITASSTQVESKAERQMNGPCKFCQNTALRYNRVSAHFDLCIIMWPQRHSCTELSATSELSLFIHIHLQQFSGIQWKLAIWFSLVLICFLLFFQQFSVFVLLYLYWKKTIPKTLRFFHIFILIIDHFPFQFRAVLSVRQQGLEFVCGYFFSFHCSGNTVYMFTIFQVSHELMWGTIPASTSRCLKYIHSKWLFDAAVGAFM